MATHSVACGRGLGSETLERRSAVSCCSASQTLGSIPSSHKGEQHTLYVHIGPRGLGKGIAVPRYAGLTADTHT